MDLTRRDFLKTSAQVAVAAATVQPKISRYRVGAYYFPNWHVDPRNEKVHGKKWTEWELLKRAEPRFEGHQQPKRPLWGFEDEADPRVFEKKIAAAHEAHLSHFIFDWYWYEGAPFLQRALEDGYLHAPNRSDVKFCLMWANHDWGNVHPGRLMGKIPGLYAGTYSPLEVDMIADYVIARYFKEPSYLCVDGCPYFSIYEFKTFVDRIGGMNPALSAINRFREKTRQAGFRDLHLNAVAWGVNGVTDIPGFLSEFKVASVTSYCWAHHFPFAAFPAVDYRDAVANAPQFWKGAESRFGVPYHPDVSMGWDPSPRSCQSDKYEKASYPFTSILSGNTPALFRQSLVDARKYLESHPTSDIVTINAWNEWTEGSYLEPDTINRLEYLMAIRDVFGS